jgi:CheY-like chemotaxis protein/anti-sigma regulatory factor (Ser/Thr protein kinase)
LRAAFCRPRRRPCPRLSPNAFADEYEDDDEDDDEDERENKNDGAQDKGNPTMTTILVVDDSKVDQRLVGGLLEKNERLTIAYADNGAEAAERMARVLPDLIVTDLQMPEMDGLELVAYTREHFPRVPVVLVTAHGSEDIAVAALERGAASYVPKSQLADRLLVTVEQVLAMVRAERSQTQLLKYLTDTEFNFCLENDPELVAPLVDHVQQVLTAVNLCDETGRVRVGVALEEALLNALYHGNLELTSEELHEFRSRLLEADIDPVEERRALEPYASRRIHVHGKITDREASITIRDEGPGFDVSQVPNPQTPENLEKENGRGLMLIQWFMDEVRFNDKGNEITMIKWREVPCEVDEDQADGQAGADGLSAAPGDGESVLE